MLVTVFWTFSTDPSLFSSLRLSLEVVKAMVLQRGTRGRASSVPLSTLSVSSPSGSSFTEGGTCTVSERFVAGLCIDPGVDVGIVDDKPGVILLANSSMKAGGWCLASEESDGGLR